MCYHNTRFHNFLLHERPPRAYRALDVGCGTGMFAKRLAENADFVDAIDVDHESVAVAASSMKEANLHFRVGDFLKLELEESSYNFISAIATVHHMDLEQALMNMKSLLKPCGVVAILGLYRESTVMDCMYTAVSVPLKIAFQMSHHQNPTEHTPRIRAPQMTLREIGAVADRIMPENQLRRHLVWRYSLVWRKDLE